jgi:hypothetical protein
VAHIARRPISKKFTALFGHLFGMGKGRRRDRQAERGGDRVSGKTRSWAQYTAPLAVIGQTCSTRLPRMQTYQS